MPKPCKSFIIEIHLENFNAMMRRVNDLTYHIWHEMIYKNKDQERWAKLPLKERVTIGLLTGLSRPSHSTFLVHTYETGFTKTLAMYAYEISKGRLRVELVDGWNPLAHEDTQPMGDDFITALTELIISEVKFAENRTEVDVPGEAKEPIGGRDPNPWDMITDYRWDRMALKLWWERYDCNEIARKIDNHITGKTVRNRLTELRKHYGESIVPTKKKLSKIGNKIGT
jgi:hypothetical protein